MEYLKALNTIGIKYHHYPQYTSICIARDMIKLENSVVRASLRNLNKVFKKLQMEQSKIGEFRVSILSSLEEALTFLEELRGVLGLMQMTIVKIQGLRSLSASHYYTRGIICLKGGDNGKGDSKIGDSNGKDGNEKIGNRSDQEREQEQERSREEESDYPVSDYPASDVTDREQIESSQEDKEQEERDSETNKINTILNTNKISSDENETNKISTDILNTNLPLTPKKRKSEKMVMRRKFRKARAKLEEELEKANLLGKGTKMVFHEIDETFKKEIQENLIERKLGEVLNYCKVKLVKFQADRCEELIGTGKLTVEKLLGEFKTVSVDFKATVLYFEGVLRGEIVNMNMNMKESESVNMNMNMKESESVNMNMKESVKERDGRERESMKEREESLRESMKERESVSERESEYESENRESDLDGWVNLGESVNMKERDASGSFDKENCSNRVTEHSPSSHSPSSHSQSPNSPSSPNSTNSPAQEDQLIEDFNNLFLNRPGSLKVEETCRENDFEGVDELISFFHKILGREGKLKRRKWWGVNG